MDLLYILGDGSKFENEELRYSLRTVEKYVKNLGHVIVIGEDPGFLSDEVEFYPIAEALGNKGYRISQKILWACLEEIVTGDFLFMNDDFFLTKEIDPCAYPYRYSAKLGGTLQRASRKKGYPGMLNATYEYLRSIGKTQRHFDVHVPIVYNVEKYVALQSHFLESRKSPFGFVVKSLYSNIYNIPGEMYEDVKLHHLNTPTDFERIEKTDCFSCSDAGWFHGVGDYLSKIHPDPSRFER